MNITILDNREIIIKTSDTFGTQNENKASIINFSFPESLINANKKIVFITDDGVYWDLITNNSYKITNAVTKYKTVSAYVWLVDVEKDIDFRSKSWKITFNKNEEPDDVVPTEEEISGFDTMIAQLNTAIAEVDNIDIDAEKVGDTAIVTITNKQGTQKSVEIKDGSDYVITEDDYREIANIVEADLPENYYNKTETNNLLDGKVDKETGKSLIETSKIEKLDGIETGAEVNIVEDIKVNGTSLEVEEKAVNIPVPTELKDLTDDSTHRTVTDIEKTTWNNKADISDIPDVSGFITKDVNNLTNYTLKTATGSLIDLEINQSTYVVTLTLKDIDGNVISTDNIDLPLESVVVDGRYDNTTKRVILTLENGSEVSFSVADLVAGLQTEITSSNKLSSDLVDDSNSGNKFVTTSEKNSWNAKYDKPNGGIPKTDLDSSVGASLDKADNAIQEADLTDYVKNTDYATSSKGGVIKVNTNAGTNIDSSGNLVGREKTYGAYQSLSNSSFISKGTLENVIAGKNLETANNKVTEIDENSTDTEYPSAKLLYDELAEKQEQIDGLVTENALLKDQIPNGTAEGTNVQITDSSNLPIEDGVIKGYTSQESTTGKNLFKPIANATKQGVTLTYNEDGSYTLDGTADANTSFYITNLGYGSGTYVMSANNQSINSSVILQAETSSGNVNFSLDATNKSISFIKDDINVLTIVINNGAVLNNFKIFPQLELGSSATSFEKYTGGQPSPNPDYKQDVHTVTGDCEVEVVSKNLFDKDNANLLNAYITPIGNNKNKIIELSTARTLYIPCQPNETYVISKISSARFSVGQTNETPAINVNVINITAYNSATSGTITTDSTAKYLLVFYYLSTADTLTEEEIRNSIQIEKSSTATATTYEPYREEEYRLDLWKENQFDKNNVSRINAYFNRTGNILSADVARTLYIPCKALTLYKISKVQSARFRVMYTTEIPQVGVPVNGGILADTLSEVIIKTGNNAKYLCVFYYHTTADTLTEQEILDSIQIQEAIELCKIGDYQDYLFKNVRTLRSGRANPLFNADLDEGAWYKYEVIGDADLGIDSNSVVPVNNSEDSRTQGLFQINGIPNILPNNSYNKTPNDTLSNSYVNGYVYNYLSAGRNPTDKTMSRYTKAVYIQNSSFSGYTNEQAKTALEGTILYYPLETPTYTKITDTALIAQLEAYYNSSTYRNVTNIITAGDDLAPIASIVYKKDLETLFNKLDSLEARVDLLE